MMGLYLYNDRDEEHKYDADFIFNEGHKYDGDSTFIMIEMIEMMRNINMMATFPL